MPNASIFLEPVRSKWSGPTGPVLFTGPNGQNWVPIFSSPWKFEPQKWPKEGHLSFFWLFDNQFCFILVPKVYFIYKWRHHLIIMTSQLRYNVTWTLRYLLKRSFNLNFGRFVPLLLLQFWTNQVHPPLSVLRIGYYVSYYYDHVTSSWLDNCKYLKAWIFMIFIFDPVMWLYIWQGVTYIWLTIMSHWSLDMTCLWLIMTHILL